MPPSTARPRRNRAPDRRNLVSVKTFAKECGVSTAQVRRWIAIGALSEYRLRTGRGGTVSKYSEIRVDLNEKDDVIPRVRERVPV
jgi:hypothetical protein